MRGALGQPVTPGYACGEGGTCAALLLPSTGRALFREDRSRPAEEGRDEDTSSPSRCFVRGAFHGPTTLSPHFRPPDRGGGRPQGAVSSVGGLEGDGHSAPGAAGGSADHRHPVSPGARTASKAGRRGRPPVSHRVAARVPCGPADKERGTAGSGLRCRPFVCRRAPGHPWRILVRSRSGCAGVVRGVADGTARRLSWCVRRRSRWRRCCAPGAQGHDTPPVRCRGRSRSGRPPS